MYSSFHAAVGGAIMIASPNPLGAGLAFVSHFLVDYIGESSIGDTKRSSMIEGALLIAYFLGAYLGDVLLLGLIGWVMGNLPDLIDKPNQWLRGKKQWFSCHDGDGLFKFKLGTKYYKLGYPVQWRITKEDTILYNCLATIAWLLICML